jgi:hypothetical protein
VVRAGAGESSLWAGDGDTPMALLSGDEGNIRGQKDEPKILKPKLGPRRYTPIAGLLEEMQARLVVSTS